MKRMEKGEANTEKDIGIKHKSYFAKQRKLMLVNFGEYQRTYSFKSW